MASEDCSPAHYVAESPRAARRFVRGVLSKLGHDDLIDDAELLVSEVVTNAVLHGGVGEAPVTVSPLADGIRIEVVDPADTFPAAPVETTLETPGGLGLGIVDSLSTRWGVAPAFEGKVVWFEMTRASAS